MRMWRVGSGWWALGVGLAVALAWPWRWAEQAREAALTPPASMAGAAAPDVAQLPDVLREIFAIRSRAVLTADRNAVLPLYDTRVTLGRWALEHELRRLAYVKAWTAKRGIQLVSTDVELRTGRPQVQGDRAWVYVVQSASFSYVYRDDPLGRVQQFGIGTRHSIELIWHNGRWLIRRDWFTDPLDEDTLVPDATPASCGPVTGLAQARPGPAGPEAGWGGRWWVRLLTPARALAAAAGEVPPGGPAASMPVAGAGGNYRRDAAVAYADKYCGAAWGCGNDRRYHPRYRDYTGIGGDCTNFVSQVLGDPEGGNLPQDYVWYYRFGTGGSPAWVQARSLVRYLLDSGRARLLARGTYERVARPEPNQPQGAVGRLRLGDVIGYEEKGNIVHLAVVTGRDSHGYVLVNSHTADRYHVPWDIGWDRKTVYWLLQLRD